MRRWVVILISVVLAIGLVLVGCGKSPEESLRVRTTEWITLLQSLPSGNEQQDLQRIETFLEPSAARSDRAKEFYESWTNKESPWKLITSSIEDVSISADRKSGTVRWTDVYEWTGEEIFGQKKGDRITRTQITKWKLVDKVWYRTMEAAEIK